MTSTAQLNKLKSKYPNIFLWGEKNNSYLFDVIQLAEQAIKDKAPENVTHKDNNGNWILSHKHGFMSIKGKDVAYRLFKGEIEAIAVVNDTITDYTTLECLEMDTQLPWCIPDAHFLLGIK